MKFDKKVMESGVVAAFSLALAFTAVPVYVPANADIDSQIIELTAEPTENRNENVTKQRKHINVVAATVETLPEKSQSENKKAKAEKNVKAADRKKQQETAKSKEVIKIEETAKSEETAKAKKPARAEEVLKPEETAKAIEAVKAEEITKAQETAKAEETAKAQETAKSEETAKAQETAKSEETAKAQETAKAEEEKAEEVQAQEAEACVKPEEQIAETGTQEVSPWAEKLMPNVEEFLNVRTEASSEAELAGKLHKGAAADILEQGEEWTKIRSGSVEGYVKNEFCVTGLEAEALANELGTTYATAVTGGVRVRETPSAEEDVKILDVLEEEGKIKVNKEAEQIEGWIPVKVDDQTGYISAEFVNVELELGKAISIEEEQAMIAAAEAEKAAAQQSSGTQQKGEVSASYDDVTLLGALIQCEAGSEPYEGQIAVGAVVMNRLRAGYAGSISGVIYQSGQFTPASSGALASVLASGVSGSCMSAAQEAINGADNVGGATSFRRAGSAQGIVIGNHVFF
ncbi:MAG: SH3 domain-containing protein [Lachnospiraceae bacterium]|nr:SH3 domain-containing protein [Lachnospiraceae bacterium]